MHAHAWYHVHACMFKLKLHLIIFTVTRVEGFT